MMSEALVGRLDTRSLIDRKDTADEKGFTADIIIDDAQFSLRLDKFKKEGSVTTVSFFSSAMLSKSLMSDFTELCISARMKDEIFFKKNVKNRNNISVEVKLNSPEYYTELSIESD
jgi:hypothetical protein